jgi:hypothetical protein
MIAWGISQRGQNLPCHRLFAHRWPEGRRISSTNPRAIFFKDDVELGAALTLVDRQAVVEILRDTKPGLPSYFTLVTK